MVANTMYQNQFGLQKPPFTGPTNSETLYIGATFNETHSTLRQSIADGAALILLRGVPGVGKTILGQKLATETRTDEIIVWIRCDMTSLEAFVDICLEAFKIPIESPDLHTKVQQLRAAIAQRKQANTNTVLLLDFGANLPRAILSKLVALFVLDEPTDSTPQIILIGRDELEAQLGEREFAPLSTALTLRCALPALAPQNVGPYIARRLYAAGYRGQTLFGAEASTTVAEHSGGIPRRINALCERALVVAGERGATTITPEIIQLALGELGDLERADTEEATRTDNVPYLTRKLRPRTTSGSKNHGLRGFIQRLSGATDKIVTSYLPAGMLPRGWIAAMVGFIAALAGVTLSALIFAVFWTPNNEPAPQAGARIDHLETQLASAKAERLQAEAFAQTLEDEVRVRTANFAREREQFQRELDSLKLALAAAKKVARTTPTLPSRDTADADESGIFSATEGNSVELDTSATTGSGANFQSETPEDHDTLAPSQLATPADTSETLGELRADVGSAQTDPLIATESTEELSNDAAGELATTREDTRDTIVDGGETSSAPEPQLGEIDDTAELAPSESVVNTQTYADSMVAPSPIATEVEPVSSIELVDETYLAKRDGKVETSILTEDTAHNTAVAAINANAEIPTQGKSATAPPQADKSATATPRRKATATARTVAERGLLEAASGGDTARIVEYIAAQTRINIRNLSDNTPLILAAIGGHSTAVDTLLAHDADVNLANHTGNTALSYAAWHGHDEIIRRLLRHGANIHAKDNSGRTALIDAAINGHVACVKLLIENGAKVNSRTRDKRTALSAAVWNNHKAAVVELLKNRARVNTTNRDGSTPLMEAAWNGNSEMVKLLLEHGADPNRTNDTGLTPIETAAARGHTEVVAILKNTVADPS